MSKFITILLMTYFASSCRSVERALICNEVDKYQVKPTETCIISVSRDTCYCADFDVNSWSTTSDLRRNPLEYCEGIQGIKSEFAIGEIRPKFIALQRLRESSCKVKK